MIPDIFIEFGPRSLLSIAGIITLVAGVWYVDRTWDEKGSQAYARAKANAKDPNNVTILQKDLDAAFPFPIAFLIGWAIFAISYLFPTDGSSSMEFGIANIAAVIFSITLGIVASVPMGDAVRNRKAGKKMKLSMLFALSWVGLTVSSGYTAENGTLPFVLCGIGALFIIMSMRILWKFRKMGDTWEQEGRPNPNPIVYNPGGPLFILGWFLFWVGMSSTSQGTLENGIPFYFNFRTALAFFAGCGMVPIVMMLDYAHDEGAKYLGFGTDGSKFGRFFESPLPFLIMWTLFGLSCFLSVDNSILPIDTRKILLFANCILQAVVAGIFIQTALYKQNLPLKSKLSMLFVLLFLALAFNIGFEGGIARYLAFGGAICAIAGQKTVFGDRKRGDYWMEHGEVNPNPIVYSVGEPLFMLGWILLSTAIAIPMT